MGGRGERKKMKTTHLVRTLIAVIVISAGAVCLGQDKPLGQGAECPAIILRNWEGGYTRLRDYCGVKGSTLAEKDRKVAVLMFFATDCAGCRAEIPQIQSIAQEYAGKDAVFFLVSIDRNPEEVLPSFIKEFNVRMPVLLDLYGVAHKDAFHLPAVPHTYVVSKDGKIAASLDGATVTEKEFGRRLRQELDRALGGTR